MTFRRVSPKVTDLCFSANNTFIDGPGVANIIGIVCCVSYNCGQFCLSFFTAKFIGNPCIFNFSVFFKINSRIIDGTVYTTELSTLGAVKFKLTVDVSENEKFMKSFSLALESTRKSLALLQDDLTPQQIEWQKRRVRFLIFN